MGFITRYCASGSGLARAWGWLKLKCYAAMALLVLACCTAQAAQAAQGEGIEVRSARVINAEDGYALQADFNIRLTLVLDDALHKGVPLYFVLEFDLIRPRWYWTNARLVNVQQTQRLSYNTLTRQYRVGAGALYQNFSTLKEALDYMSRVRRRLDLAPGEIAKGGSYFATLRLRLDTTQLPKPFQLHTGRDWAFNSEAYRWTVNP